VVAIILTDNATYMAQNLLLRAFCEQRGIRQVFSPPYSQYLNGKAERFGGIVKDSARTMLIHAGAPAGLWAWAVKYAVLILSAVRKKLADGSFLSPLERWTGRKLPTIYHRIKVWGCAAWVHQKHPTGPKQATFAPNSTKHLYLGIDELRQCYILQTISNRKLVYSAHVTFNENSFPCKEKKSVYGPPRHLEEPGINFGRPPPQRSSQRNWTPSRAALENIAMVAYEHACYGLEDVDDPTGHVDAMRRPDSKSWRAAEIAEYRAHMDLSTLGPRQRLPEGFTAITSSFVYRRKRDGRYKVRLALHGNRMVQGMDFNDTFASTINTEVVRLLFAFAAKHDMDVDTGDTVTAFLHTSLETEVYMYETAGFHDDPSTTPRAVDRSWVRRVNSGIPGHPEASRLWGSEAHKQLTDAGCTRTAVDHSLYVAPEIKGFVISHVDDFCMIADKACAKEKHALQTLLKDKLHIKKWAPISDFLGVTVTRDRDRLTLTMNQTDQVRKLLIKANMGDCKSVDTPAVPGFLWTRSDCPEQDLSTSDEAKSYRSILMSCLYFQTRTRPDITFVVGKLAKFMQNPGPKHQLALKRLLRYLSGTTRLGLVYDFTSSGAGSGIWGHYDSAHADDHDTRRSTWAYVFYYHSAVIAWKSKLNSFVTTATNHSEYSAGANAAKEAKFLENVACSLGMDSDVKPIALFSDSQGAIAMSYNPVQRAASKHVDLADHYVREQVAFGTISITYVRTDHMLADVFTKALPRQLFQTHTSQMVGLI